MIPFLNMRIYRSFSKNLTGFVDKMKQGELKVEDILDEDEIVQDVKSNPSTELIPFFSSEIIKKLIDFSTKMPNVPTDDKQKVDKKIGFKFPFNATEILCSDNAAIMDLFVKTNENPEEKNEEKNSDENHDANEAENQDEKKIEDEKSNDNDKIEKKEEQNSTPSDEKKEEEKKEEEEKEKKDDEKKDEEKKEEKKEEEKKEEKKDEKKDEKEEKKEKEEEKKQDDSNEKKTSEEEKEEDILPAEEDTVNQQNEKKNDSKPILEYFFDFLANTPNTESEEIYVLTGYFQRILNHLITSKGNIVIPFIFDSPQNIPDNLIKHLNKKSIAEIINKVLTYTDESLKDLNEKKKIFITKILQDLNETKNELQFECISSLLISCLDKKEFFSLFMSESSLVELLYSSINKCDGKKLRNLLNILIKINENILSNFDKPVTPNLVPENPIDLLNMIKNYGLENNNEEENQAPSNNEENLKIYLSFLFKVLKENSFSFLNDLNEFEDNQLETTYQRQQKKLGLKKLSQIEFFRSIIDICVNSYAKKYFPENVEEIIKLAEEKNIFWILNDIFLNFEFNNIFQTYYQQLFTIILNPESPEILINSVFENTKENKKLIPKLTEHLLNHMKFKYNNNENEVESGFFPTEVQILDNISKSENNYVKKFIENEEDYKVFNECFSSDINSIFKQKLYFNPENDISNPLSNEPEIEPFIPNKALTEIIKEDLDIYNEYKNGGDFKKLIEEKKEREKSEREKFNKENQNNSQEIVNDNEDNQDTDVFETNDDDDLKKDKIYGNDGINFDNGWPGDDKIISDDELEDLMKELDL